MKRPDELRPLPGRVPPHDLDAEAAVLSACFLSQLEIDAVIGTLASGMFYSDANKFVFAAIVELHGKNEPVDVVSVAAQMKRAGTIDRAGGSPYLAQLCDATPAVANIMTHAAIVKDRWQSRQAIIDFQVFAAEAYSCATPAIELIQRAENKLSELGATGIGSELVQVGEIISTEIEIHRALREAGETGRGTGASTGYRNVDEMTGGHHAGDFTVVAGRPGMGKTTFVMNMLANLARRREEDDPTDGAAFFSLEMPRGQVAMRFACAERSVPVTNVRKNRLRDEDWQNYQQGAEDLRHFPIWIDDSPTLTVLDIRARVRKLQRDITAGRTAVPCRRLRVVAVDYLQLMRGIRQGGDNREQEVSSLSRGLKALAKDLDVTVIGVSQLNRNPEAKGKKDRRPELSDLRESGAIEQDCDNAWFVYRPAYYDPEARPEDAELLIRKQRNGATGILGLAFKGESMLFLERALENYDDLSQDFETG